MSILTIILIVLLIGLLFRVGISLLRFIIKLAILALVVYLAYQGVVWLNDYFQLHLF
ncbi:hypothetical protein [Staphylococcus sp. EZ-P03]|uniref:hypothetical protein n=1 Tax=Staphylococcus sp. EZ-P03 TaxID=2282739 RepID=UPI0013C4D149|nr:hypothetical protein [Staphylococcus sp. EZ-P03]